MKNRIIKKMSLQSHILIIIQIFVIKFDSNKIFVTYEMSVILVKLLLLIFHFRIAHMSFAGCSHIGGGGGVLNFFGY